MRPLLIALLITVPSSAFAGSETAFDEMKDRATRFDGSLSSFLEHYIGECQVPDRAMAKACQSAAAQFRRENSGKRFFCIISEDQVGGLQPGKIWANGDYTVNLTPFFAAGDYAVSQGSPHHTDAQGNPVFPFVVLKGKAEDEMSAQRLMREVANHSVRVELVFTPEGLWTAKKRDGKRVFGVKASFNGIKATSSMTGQQIATMVR